MKQVQRKEEYTWKGTEEKEEKEKESEREYER
jgi:hypothetical protein